MKVNALNLIVLLIGVIIVGYIVIFVSTHTGRLSEREKLESQITASRLQLQVLKKRLQQSESELINLKSSSVQQGSASQKPLISPLKSNSIRYGVIILGMHRSGTSLIGGLINKMGLKTGGPLIQAAEDNAKGFFERIDVVLQNDYLMKKQGIHYAYRTSFYDPLIGIKNILNAEGNFFNEGRRGLSFLNDKRNYPWMLKDPRLCITLRTWLPFLNFIPAILFTYRHPLDVALSLHKREFERFEIPRGLKIWYIYNKRAVQQSEDLCRVVTSHRLVMMQPHTEFSRIYDELIACGVDVPHKLTDEEVDSFIDIKLQHGQSTLKDSVCDQDLNQISPPDIWKTVDDNNLKLYREVMRFYCALENRSAFSHGFQWDESISDG